MGLKTTFDLNLPDSKETRMFRALELVLATDPILSATVKTFVAARGEDSDLIEPTYANCPYLQILPWPTESRWITEGQHHSPLTVRFLAVVKGSKFDNIANFWNVIRLAVFPQETEQRERVRQILMGYPDNDLATAATNLLPAYGPTKDVEGLRLSLAEGTLVFPLLIRT